MAAGDLQRWKPELLVQEAGSVLVATALPRGRRGSGRWWTPNIATRGPVDPSDQVSGDGAVWLWLRAHRQGTITPITLDLRCPRGHWRPVRLARLHKAIVDAVVARRRELVTFLDL